MLFNIDMNHQTKDKLNTEKIVENIINNGKCCINFSVKEVITSSILPKIKTGLTRLILKVNERLREQCILNKFSFISNDYISRNR